LKKYTAIFILTSALIAGLAIPVCSQDKFRERIQSIQKEFALTTGMDIVMDIKAFESKAQKIPFYHEQAIVKKSSDNYFYRFSGLEMLMNEKYLVMVNEKQRLITCTLRDKKAETEMMDPLTANLDSMLNFYGTPRLISDKDDVEHYTLTRSDGLITQIELYIQASTNSLKRIEYGYEGGQYATINFLRFNRTPDFKANEFNEQRYFSENNGVLKLSDNYSRFRLTTQ
jgi:hypothetical protein